MKNEYNLTVDEVVGIVGCHRNTVLRYEKEGYVSPKHDRNREDEQGHIFLTPDCMTKMEFEEAGESLIQEIKLIIKEAKKKFEH